MSSEAETVELTFTGEELESIGVAREELDIAGVDQFVREAVNRLLGEVLDEGQPLECPHDGCEETFATVRQRRGHLGNAHAQEFPEGDFWCGYCGFKSSWRGVNAHHAHRHSERGPPIRLDHEPAPDELLAPEDVPDHQNAELLEQLYSEHGGSITEMCRAHDFDVQQGRVRHYLIEFGIHEPTPHGSSEDGPRYRNREFLEQQYDRFEGNISEMHRELDLEVSYRGLVNILKRWGIHDASDPPGKHHGKGGQKPASDYVDEYGDGGSARGSVELPEEDLEDIDVVAPADDAPDASADDGQLEDLHTDLAAAEEEEAEPPDETEVDDPRPDIDFEFEAGFHTVAEREQRSSDRVVEDPFCPRCGDVYTGDGVCESCSKGLEEDLVA